MSHGLVYVFYYAVNLRGARHDAQSERMPRAHTGVKYRHSCILLSKADQSSLRALGTRNCRNFCKGFISPRALLFQQPCALLVKDVKWLTADNEDAFLHGNLNEHWCCGRNSLSDIDFTFRRARVIADMHFLTSSGYGNLQDNGRRKTKILKNA